MTRLPWRRRVRMLGCVDADIGGKARNLIWLDRAGANVPRTWVVCGGDSLTEIASEGQKFAVRSSFPAEDSLESAHAGEFATFLDVDPEGVGAAVSEVLRSGSGNNAVVVQHMVNPVVSGVVFSRDPVTGLSDVVVEAFRGRGDQILSGGANPLRWVSRNGTFVESAEVEDELHQLIVSVVARAKKLASRYGRPADLEWVWDGESLWWVQIRPITAIENVPIFSCRISRDVMPGMIKPLVWSTNVPMVNTAWARLISEAIGPNDIRPDELAASYAYRSYFDMRVFGDIFERLGMPRDSLENLLGLPGEKGRMKPGLGALAGLPRLLALAWKLRSGLETMANQRETLQGRFVEMSQASLSEMSDVQLVDHVREIQRLGVEAAYLNIVVPLQANFYSGWLGRRTRKWTGHDIHDLEPPPKGVWDFTPELNRLREALRSLPVDDLEGALEGDISLLGDEASALLADFLERFGHMSESVNDMSVPRWREVPPLVLKLAVATEEATADGSGSWSDAESSLGWIRRSRFRRLRHRTERLSILREAMGSTFTYGYGLLRPGFLELGGRMAERGLLDAAGDVFYLTEQDVVDAVLSSSSSPLREKVEAVKLDMADVADLVMPETIIGDHWVPASAHVADQMRGVGTSRGRYRGMARYVPSIADADSLQPGDILVIDRSDVAWTPIFSRAGAVITEAGGLLAHSSITAREMGVPCVASVPGARRLDGAIVLVDGSTGEVFLEGPA